MNAVMRSPNTSRSFQDRMIARLSLRDRRVWLAAAIAAIIGGLAFNWGWLVAVGAAPLLIGVLPCAALCALRLYAKPGGQRCKKDESSMLSGEQEAHTESDLTRP